MTTSSFPWGVHPEDSKRRAGSATSPSLGRGCKKGPAPLLGLLYSTSTKSRFQYIEQQLKEEDKNISDVSLKEMDKHWNSAKTEADQLSNRARLPDRPKPCRG